MSLFISFEGCDGTGKSTQARLMEERLVEAGYKVVLVKEPGSTRLGDYLRSWLKDENNTGLTPEAELFLFAAARSALVSGTLRPLLKEDRTVVIADRYIDSTTAYQGYGRRMDLDEVAQVNRLATGGLTPDITILLDGSIRESLRRVGTSQLTMAMGQDEQVGRIDGEGTRRFKEESVHFHERVRRGYRKIAQQDSERVVLIEALRPIPEVADAIFAAVEPRLPTDPAQTSCEAHSLPLWNAAENTSIAETA